MAKKVTAKVTLQIELPPSLVKDAKKGDEAALQLIAMIIKANPINIEAIE